MERRAAFFDVDNTLMHGSSLFFFSKGMYQHGFFGSREIISFIFANLKYQLLGERSKAEIEQIRSAALSIIKGHEVAELKSLGNDIYDRYVSPKLWQGTIEIAHEHLNKGEEVWLVTASPIELAELIAARLGFTGALGTVAETKDGIYTGELIGNFLHGKEKAVAVAKLAGERGIELSSSFAYSDSHNDLPLLTCVGKPRAINPDPQLQIRAMLSNWPIYDFRRGRWLKRLIAPVFGRLAGLISLLHPAMRKREKREKREKQSGAPE
jgi:HAD superfamily hydrolase (TIGR01490 family)